MANSKIKKLFLIPIIIILVFVVGLFVFINPLLDKAKPLLLSTVSNSLGSEVNAGVISASVFPAPGFLLEDVSINDKGKKLLIGKTKINISISDALRGMITLVSAEVSKVKLSAKMLEDGSFLIDGINLPSTKEQAATNNELNQKVVQDISDAQTSKDSSQALTLAIEKLEITDVILEVFNEKTKVLLPINLNMFSFKKDGQKGKLNGLVKLPQGSVTIDGYTQSYKIDPKNLALSTNVLLDFTSLDELTKFVGTDLSRFGISNLKTNILVELPKADVKDLTISILDQVITIKGVLEDFKNGGGAFQVNVDSFDMSKLGAINDSLKSYSGALNKFKCDINLKAKEEVNLECLLSDSSIRGVALLIKSLKASSRLIDPKTFKLENFDLNLAGGNLSITADGISGGLIKTKVLGNNLSIPELQKLTPNYDSEKPSMLEGSITNLSSDLSIQGQNKTGNFSVQIAPFSIKGVNIFKKVTDAFEVIPALGWSLTSAVPSAYGAILLSENTEFQSIKVSGTIQNSRINLNDFQANSKGYRVVGKGSLDSGSIDLDASLIMEADLVSAIEAGQPKIASIKNTDGTIVVPLKIKKGASDSVPLIIPDVENLLKQQIGIQLKNNAKKAIDKVVPGLGGVVDGLFN